MYVTGSSNRRHFTVAALCIHVNTTSYESTRHTHTETMAYACKIALGAQFVATSPDRG